MLGSIYIGMSGLTAYSRGLQTISNNVTNLNSPGYKATAIRFGDVFSYGGNGLVFGGGGAESRAGSGVRFGEARIDFSQGELRQSEGDLDLAIQGSGFLTLLRGGKTFYARTGQFVADNDGYIIQQGTDYRLGFLGGGQLAALNIDAKRTSPPIATTKVKFADNLSSSATTATVADVVVFDALGERQTWQVKFDKDTGVAGQWTVTVTDQTGVQVGAQQLRFVGSSVDPSTAKLAFSTNRGAAGTLSVEFDFSTGVTSFSSGTVSTVRAASVDGNATGTLATITVDDEGQIKLSYSNGKTETLGTVAIADFRDPQQLVRLSDGIYDNGRNNPVRLLKSNSDGAGRLLAKRSEASNVDLSQQFGDLILVQRGFQASSQVVSTTNDMIQQLFGIRGQG